MIVIIFWAMVYCPIVFDLIYSAGEADGDGDADAFGEALGEAEAFGEADTVGLTTGVALTVGETFTVTTGEGLVAVVPLE